MTTGHVVSVVLWTVLATWAASAHESLTVTMHGARGDGTTHDTKAVQAAIDAGAALGGASVRFPPGVYLCGSLHLKSGVTLELDAGATILGSPDDGDFDPYEELGFDNDSDRETSFFHFALIWGEDVENIGIVGQGTIDGNRSKRGGPKPIALKRCRNVAIRGIRIVNAPNYCISMLGTDDVNIDGVTIRQAHCDGIDPDSCRNVRISNCDIQSWDDAIVPKASFTLGERRACENIAVTNCLLATAANAFKLGTESGGDFKRIAVSNCVVYQRPETQPATSGISLESVDGSHIDGVVISNVTMTGVQAPIFLRLGNRGRDMETPVPGSLRNVIISNIVATDATITSSIVGIPGHRIEGVTLSDIRLVYAALPQEAKVPTEVPEHEAKYPSAHMFGVLPAYGLYVRHADGLKLRNVQVLVEGNEPRPALWCDDVKHLEVESFTPSVTLSEAVLRCHNVQDAFFRGCVAPRGTRTWLHVDGGDTRSIALSACHLGFAAKPWVTGEEVDRHEVAWLVP